MAAADPEVGLSVSIINSMMTPTLLILAAAAIVGSTTGRLERIMSSMHQLAESFERHLVYDQDRATLNEEQIGLMEQIERTTTRMQLLQLAVLLLHASILGFVVTEVALGVDAATDLSLGLLPVFIGLIGAILLFAAIAILVYDTFIAQAATRDEALFTLRMTEHHAANARRAGESGTRPRVPVSWS